MVATRWAGLGAIRQSCYGKAQGSDRYHILLEEVREGVEEEQSNRVVGIQQHRAWTIREGLLERKTSYTSR